MVTTFGLACGLFVIFRMVLLRPSAISYTVILMSTLLLLLAAVADLLDGAIARLLKAESEFGVLFDSLSDAITFGVAPAVLMLKSLQLGGETKLGLLASTGAMLFAICGVLRLVRFNVKAAAPSLDNTDPAYRSFKIFTGLPIPAAASVAVSTSLFLLSAELKEAWYMSHGTRVILLTCVMVLLAYLMVSRWKFPGIKVLQLRVNSIHLLFVSVLAAVLFFYGVVYYFAFVFFALSWLYLIVAWSLSIARLVIGKRAAALDDFEPAPEALED
jgi:CDP-diacylglycerol---serine O-phosphatidyltransferase